MIGFSALASGGNGNSYFFQDSNDAVLVDAGIQAREILDRMEELQISSKLIKGIFVSHEHSDHIRGVEQLSQQLNVPVYISKKTYAAAEISLPEKLLRFIEVGSIIRVGKITVHCYSKCHDAADPCSFSLESEGRKVSVMTDFGARCKNIVSHLATSDAVFLEANYDEEMLENGPYPSYLKRRIASNVGHLSNYQAGLLVLEHATPKLKYVLLSHFSASNNKPDLAVSTFSSVVRERKDLDIRIFRTSRERATPILTLE